MDTEGYLSKSTLSYKFNELVKLLGSGRQLLILFYVKFVVSDEALSLLHY